MSKWWSRADKRPAPVIITNALDPLSADQRGRQRRYFISMMVRTGCFIASIFLPNPYRWFSMAGAILLPYIAVVLANAGRETVSAPNSLLREKQRQIAGK